MAPTPGESLGLFPAAEKEQAQATKPAKAKVDGSGVGWTVLIVLP